MKWGDGKRDDGCFFALTKWVLTLLVLVFLFLVFGQVALAQGPQETAVPGDALIAEPGACLGGFRRSQDPNIVGVFLQQDDNLLALLAPNEVLHFAGRYNRLWLDWSEPGILDFLVIDSRGFHREDLTAPSWLDLSRASTLRVEYRNVPGNRQTLFYQEVVGGPCQEVPPPTPTPTPSPPPQAVLDAEISCSAALFDLTTNVAGRIEYKLSVNGEDVLAGAWEIYEVGQYENLAVAWPEPLTGYEPYALDIEAEFVDESGQELDWAHTWTDGVICATPPPTPTPSPQASLTVVPSCAGVRLFGSSEVEADLRYSAMAELTDTLYLQGALRIGPGDFDEFIPWPSELDEYGEYHLFVEGLLNGESGLRRRDHARVDRTCGVPATPPPSPPKKVQGEICVRVDIDAPQLLGSLRLSAPTATDPQIDLSLWLNAEKRIQFPATGYLELAGLSIKQGLGRLADRPWQSGGCFANLPEGDYRIKVVTPYGQHILGPFVVNEGLSQQVVDDEFQVDYLHNLVLDLTTGFEITRRDMRFFYWKPVENRTVAHLEISKLEIGGRIESQMAGPGAHGWAFLDVKFNTFGNLKLEDSL